MSQRILAKAVVDVDQAATPIRLGKYTVEVWGEPPHDYVRVYTLRARSDTMAAQEGLRLFVEDIERLLSEKG
jgi:hypothetical protein